MNRRRRPIERGSDRPVNLEALSRLVRPLLLLTGPLTQPLAQTYIDFVLSVAGQTLVEADGWIPIK